VKKLRIYVDTSVIGGCYDPEFKVWSGALIEDFRHRRYVPVLSDVTSAEVAPAPRFVQALHQELVALPAEVVSVTNEIVALVESYTARSVLGARFVNDMLHIALATVAEVDVLVSWNFKHIVRLDKIRLFNAVNLEQGYKALAIYSPREVISYGAEE
jgi:predicted nucleic acid-binding protein